MLKTKLIRANTQVVDGAAGKVHAVVSTEARDRDGDVVRAGGWDLEAFMEHPILLASHSYHQLRSQVGEWEEMKVTGARLEGVARYYVGEGNPEADWGFNLASKGMAAYSVGFIPDMARARALGRDGGWSGYEFNGQELLEVSHVTIPSNPDALQRLKAARIHPAVAEVVEALRSFQNGEPDERSRDPRRTQGRRQRGKDGDPVQALAALLDKVADGAPSPEPIHHPMNRLMREARDMVLDRGMREIDQNTLTALAADRMDQRLCRMEQKQQAIMERLGGGIHVRFSKRSLTVTAGTMASIAGVTLGLVKALGG